MLPDPQTAHQVDAPFQQQSESIRKVPKIGPLPHRVVAVYERTS